MSSPRRARDRPRERAGRARLLRRPANLDRVRAGTARGPRAACSSRRCNDNPGVPGFRATLALALSEGSRPDEAQQISSSQAVAPNFSGPTLRRDLVGRRLYLLRTSAPSSDNHEPPGRCTGCSSLGASRSPFRHLASGGRSACTSDHLRWCSATTTAAEHHLSAGRPGRDSGRGSALGARATRADQRQLAEIAQ